MEESVRRYLKKKAAKYLGVPSQEISTIKVLRKSLDARKIYHILQIIRFPVYINEPGPKTNDYNFDYKDVSKAKEIHIIGFGSSRHVCRLALYRIGL